MATKDVNLKFPEVHPSLDAFKAATIPGWKRSMSEDPLAKFEKHDGEDWWTGQIVVYDGKPLPSTVKVASKVEVREKSRKGWLPVAMIDAEIRKMFVDFYAGKEMPASLAKALQPEPAKFAAPEPAKK